MNKKTWPGKLLGTVLCALSPAAAAQDAPAPPPLPAAPPAEAEPAPYFEILGIITYVGVEGGFYGILADDGGKYQPLYLPEAFRQEGQRVRVTAALRPGLMGIHMWGRYIRIVDIVPSACVANEEEMRDN